MFLELEIYNKKKHRIPKNKELQNPVGKVRLVVMWRLINPWIMPKKKKIWYDF